MTIKGLEIIEPINEESKIRYIQVLLLDEINNKLDKIIEGAETPPLLVSEEKISVDMDIDKIKEIADARGVKYAKNIKKQTLIKKLEG